MKTRIQEFRKIIQHALDYKEGIVKGYPSFLELVELPKDNITFDVFFNASKNMELKIEVYNDWGEKIENFTPDIVAEIAETLKMFIKDLPDEEYEPEFDDDIYLINKYKEQNENR